jgi:uncharacterized membrane protein HdeD (DUF308 family)
MRAVHVRMLFVRSRWMLALRGLMAVLFGVAACVWPGLVLAALLDLFSAFALIAGLFAVFPLEGPVGTIASVITLLWPAIRVLALLDLAAALAMGTGLLEIVASLWIRHMIGHGWPLLLDGIMMVLLGVILVLRPVTSASAILWLCGAYAVVSGLTLLCFAFRLKRLMMVRKEV